MFTAPPVPRVTVTRLEMTLPGGKFRLETTGLEPGPNGYTVSRLLPSRDLGHVQDHRGGGGGDRVGDRQPGHAGQLQLLGDPRPEGRVGRALDAGSGTRVEDAERRDRRVVRQPEIRVQRGGVLGARPGGVGCLNLDGRRRCSTAGRSHQRERRRSRITDGDRRSVERGRRVLTEVGSVNSHRLSTDARAVCGVQ